MHENLQKLRAEVEIDIKNKNRSKNKWRTERKSYFEFVLDDFFLSARKLLNKAFFVFLSSYNP